MAVAAVTVAAAPPLPQGTGSPSISGDEQVISSNSSPVATPVLCRQTSSGSTSELIDENERLRKENSQLNRELSQMKNLCNNIYALMSNYANKPAETGSPAVKPLDLLPLKRYCGGETSADGVSSQSKTEAETETSPRLFGVAIGAKRLREGEAAAREGAAPEDRDLQLQLGGAEVKSEPFDHRNDDDDGQETAWIRQCNRTNHRGRATD